MTSARALKILQAWQVAHGVCKGEVKRIVGILVLMRVAQESQQLQLGEMLKSGTGPSWW